MLRALTLPPDEAGPRVDITELTPRPSFSARRDPQELTEPMRQARLRRLTARSRREAERKVQLSQMHDWLSSHSLVAVPRVEISKTRKAALRECFAILDADGGGTINMSELSLAMKALGFSGDAVKQAMEQGDRDGDGQLNFEEFVALLARAGGPGGGGGDGLGSDQFPFALIANSYRISKLVDSHNPALQLEKSAARELARQGTSALPPIAYAKAQKLAKDRTRGTGLHLPKQRIATAPRPEASKRGSKLPSIDARRGRLSTS